MEAILQAYHELKNSNHPLPFGEGHINDTYLVDTPSGKYILQKVNPKVFDTEVLVQNLSRFFDALASYEKETGQKLTPAVIKNKNGDFHTLDHDGAAWRLVEFFPGCNSYPLSPNENITFHAAEAMGKFQRFLNRFSMQDFGETIPNFHNPHRRLQVFLSTLQESPASLQKQAAPEIEFVLSHQNIAVEIKKLLDSNAIPRRITHNDTKLDNLLFLPGGRVLVIDLDTVMPGHVIFDYGDMVRTYTSPVKEDEKDIAKVQLRIPHFRALTQGYLQALKDVLTEPEKQNLLLGAKAILYEQTLRFLTDFLMGNVYYKTDYPEHNLVRTRTQIKLLSDILQQENELLEIIRKILRMQ